jgi:hypothetical protein
MRIEIRELIPVLAKELAHSDDEMQSTFFNVFSAELQISCRGKTETQLCYLSDKLNRDGKYLVKELAEFVNLRLTSEANV